MVLALIIESEKPTSLVTYAAVPSALIATAVGRLPVAIVAATLFDAVLITETDPELPLVTKTLFPFGVIARPFG
jgi:hypothetical protein